jgi:acyl transferase domain-containing protein
MNREPSLASSPDIAVIGYAARVPGAGNAGQFWENLTNGVEAIRFFSAGELESVGVSKTRLDEPHYVKAGAPLAQLDAFDAGFFGISPRDAGIMDPQHRLFLESAWEALEHAGYAPGTFTGSTGVFAGSGTNAYLIQNLLSDPDLVETEGLFLLRQTGNDKDVLATRISYQMNLRGPSLNIQTGQSTSLVAVHLACQTLLHQGCDMAIAGAVSIELPHAVGYRYRQNEVLSRDGHCRAFDAASTGTVFGSGLGIVILRRLSDALATGDTVHAVIKGTAINNDGNRKGGFLAPSVAGQVEVITNALAAAGVEPGSIDYIETHGTGTPIGDPIELNALSQVFGERTSPLKIGSVKTNVGHLDTAAGMAGLIKTVAALSHGQIPPTLNFKNFDPKLASETAKLQVVEQLTEWKSIDGPRRAGVTSLGIGGTNAHVVLEESPQSAPSQAGRTVSLFAFSAKSDTALNDATLAFADHLRQFPEQNLADAAYTQHVGRSEFAHRRFFIARDPQEALQLAELTKSSAVITGKASDAGTVAFLFSGQGSQYCNMGREIYQTERVFRKWLDVCAEQAKPHMGIDFRDVLYPPEAELAHAAEQIKLTWNAQPILFSFEYALAQLWLSWGVRPAKLVGHSLGEYTAACLSGVFTLEDVIPLICTRGNLMKKVSEGAMLAVGQSEKEVARWIKDDLCLAAVNGLEQCVISGPTAAILALRDQLKQEGIPSHRLETSHAFHSGSIDPVLEMFMDALRQKKMRAPQIPIISNVTGTWLKDKEATDPAYWARHFRGTVRFHDGLKALESDPGCFLLEVGPGETLCTFARRNRAKDSQQKICPTLPRSGGKTGEVAGVLAGRLIGTSGKCLVDHTGQGNRQVACAHGDKQRCDRAGAAATLATTAGHRPGGCPYGFL